MKKEERRKRKKREKEERRRRIKTRMQIPKVLRKWIKLSNEHHSARRSIKNATVFLLPWYFYFFLLLFMKIALTGIYFWWTLAFIFLVNTNLSSLPVLFVSFFIFTPPLPDPPLLPFLPSLPCHSYPFVIVSSSRKSRVEIYQNLATRDSLSQNDLPILFDLSSTSPYNLQRNF